MSKWPGAPFWGSLHPAGAENKTLISDTAYYLVNILVYVHFIYISDANTVNGYVKVQPRRPQ